MITHLGQWLPAFKVLHQKARNGSLAGEELHHYLKLRAEMAETLVADRLKKRPGQPPRKMIRVTQAAQVDLELVGGRQRLLTNSLSAGGFSGLLPKDPGKGTSIGFSLRLPVSPLVGRAKVVNAQRRAGNYLVSFSFVDLPSAEKERLEIAIFDMIIRELEG